MELVYQQLQKVAQKYTGQRLNAVPADPLTAISDVASLMHTQTSASFLLDFLSSLPGHKSNNRPHNYNYDFGQPYQENRDGTASTDPVSSPVNETSPGQ